MILREIERKIGKVVEGLYPRKTTFHSIAHKIRLNYGKANPGQLILRLVYEVVHQLTSWLIKSLMNVIVTAQTDLHYEKTWDVNPHAEVRPRACYRFTGLIRRI